MKLNPVEKSSVFAAVGYDPAAQELFIEFKGGAVHRYDEFTPADWHAFCTAESKGRHFGQNIRGKFKSEKIHPQAGEPREPGSDEPPDAA